jgi:hypothetical protein
MHRKAIVVLPVVVVEIERRLTKVKGWKERQGRDTRMVGVAF